MTEIWFYHLQRQSLEAVLPALLEKVLAAGKRAVVMLGSEERSEAVNNLLWTYNDRGFLPHGSARDGFPSEQPIWLTTNDENPNNSEILVLTEGARSAHLDRYQRCLELFDGNDAEAVASARLRWKSYKEAGHDVAYWQQDARGRWERKG
ncbi:MAG TPA: DNA polymerase III subunit chi [Alphaproteobacteria bacterium]|nr:DNA polymerase III subunit chi [Alphaproteobacteria bacterium]